MQENLAARLFTVSCVVFCVHCRSQQVVCQEVVCQEGSDVNYVRIQKTMFAESPPSFGSELPVSEKKNASSVGKIVVCGEHRVSDLELTVPD